MIAPEAAARLKGLLGLAVRAEQAGFGTEGCLNSIRRAQCAMVLLDGGASSGTKDKIHSACELHGIRCCELPEGMLGQATGKPGVVMTVKEGGLAQQIRNRLPDSDPVG